MKKKQRKTVQKKLAAGVVALIALGFGLGSSVQGAECMHGPGTHGKCSCSSRVLPNIQHEMVPHVVLPETIQYNSVAHTQRRPNFDLDRAGDYGMVNPFVATYTAFPSYQVPYMTEMRTVNQSVYPVSPQPKPLPLPAKKEESTMDFEDDSFELSSDEPLTEPQILLASNTEEIVHAAPLSDLDNDIAQTGIFCQKPAKPPAAWSFTSPIFKAASVPMGWGPAGHSGFINQQGPRGCSTQIGFNPMMGGGMAPQNGMQPGMMPGMMQPPMRTFQMGHGAGMGGNGVQAQQLPNGMVLLTAPPDHSRCGLIRCRCGSTPRMMLLPGAPGGMPMPQQAPDAAMMYGMPGMMGGMPGGMNPAMNGMMGGMPMQNVGMNGMMQHPLMQQQLMQQQMMQQQMMQSMMQPQVQVVPMSVMTPYGPMFAGYQAVSMVDPMQQMMQASMMQNPMMQGQMMGGMGMMPANVAQQLQQQVQSAQNLQATDDSGMKDAESSEQLQAPLPLGGQALPGLNSACNAPGMMVSPFGMMYAQQANPGMQGDVSGGAEGMGNAGMMNPMMNQAMMPQMMYMTPPMMMPQMNANSFAGTYMTPYGMMTMNPMPGQGTGMNYGGMNNGMNPMMMGFGMMPCGMNGMNPMMGMGGMNGMNPMAGMGGMNRNEGISTSDLLMLMMVMNNNKPEPRQGPIRRLFSRIREGRQGRMADNDPFQQLMQAWSTPYYAPDSMARMPSRSAYPYGYFGAQPGAMDTANYGGFYNLYMGNTSYPGMY